MIVDMAAALMIYADNPIKKGFGMADPHIYIFNDTAYLYSTRDAEMYAKKFIMPDWDIWKSTDLVSWEHVRTITPEETYMGKSNDCWATETVCRNGLYYFYFSDSNKSTGVMRSNSPEGPFIDLLHKPLLPSDLTSGKEYDPTVLIDNGQAYIVFGHYRKDTDSLKYHIAQLNSDMMSLAEAPKVVQIEGDEPFLTANDKPNLHKRNGMFYLSAGSHYAVAKNIYGPYRRRGNSGNNSFGLTERAHGNYFSWHNQWFHTWCNFFLGKDVGRFRESYITYLHYRNNGDMVSDTRFLDKHFATGVGQYDADWDCIETEWFMAASKENLKRESSDGGFEIANMRTDDFVCYPNIHHLGNKTKMLFHIQSRGEGIIELHENAADGRLIGRLDVRKNKHGIAACAIAPSRADKTNLYMVFKSKTPDFCSIDCFSFK